MFGVKEPALRKRLLHERKLTLEKAIDICKSGETTAQHLKDLVAATDMNEVTALKLRDDKKTKITERPNRFKECLKMQILLRKSRAQEGKMSGVWKDLRKMWKE